MCDEDVVPVYDRRLIGLIFEKEYMASAGDYDKTVFLPPGLTWRFFQFIFEDIYGGNGIVSQHLCNYTKEKKKLNVN